MARSNALPPEQVAKIVQLRQQGALTWKEIADTVGVGLTVAKKYWKRFKDSGEKPIIDSTPDSPNDFGDDTEQMSMGHTVDQKSGVVETVSKDGWQNPEEIRAECGLPDDWVATHFKPNKWQNFIKVLDPDRPEGFKAEKVELFQSKVLFTKAVNDDLRKAIIEFCEEHVEPLPAPDRGLIPMGEGESWREWISSRPEQIATVGLWDAHVGMYAHDEECGNSYDVKKAKNRCMNAIDDAVEELQQYNIKRVLCPMGNDFMHFDNVRHTTSHGDHSLDFDSRFTLVYRACIEILNYTIERLHSLPSQPVVDAFWIPGNHDYGSSFGICAAVAERYRNYDRVTVDLGANPCKFRVNGGTVLMFDHGKDIPVARMPMIFHERVMRLPEYTGQKLTYKEVQIGHTHQKRTVRVAAETPTNGLYVVTNPALCDVDFYHHSHGWDGEVMKSIEVRRYDDIGFRGSHACWACDDDRSHLR